jgi:alkylhydroperoxidase/carboxymuconolactone decarboxylase family protein YurZ
MLTASQAAVYRKLTIGDEVLLASLFADAGPLGEVMDERTSCLVRLAAVIIADPAVPAYQREVRDALDAGASPEQITAVLLAVSRVAGSAAVMSAAPKLALALGYDVDAALADGDADDEEP